MDAAMVAALVVLALLVARALLAATAGGRARAMLAALLLAPVALGVHVRDTPAVESLRDRPGLLAAGIVLALAGVAALALLFARRPAALPLAAVAALPFRVPIEVGGATANLLLPLYAVVGAGVLSWAWPRFRGPAADDDAPRAGWLERVLALVVVLYAVQAAWSSDQDKALENALFFYVPFALLFVLLTLAPWTRRLAVACLGVLTALALVFVAIGFGEYATRTLLLNPKVIASNQFEDYFRVSSLFFDPNIYGRFLMVVMLALCGVLLWERRPRPAAVAALLLAVLWGGLVLTFSQSSFAGLLLGLAVLGALRWGTRRALAVGGTLVAAGAAVVLLAPGMINLELSGSDSLDSATSGRYDLVAGGIGLAADRPLTGHGSGSFAREYRRAEDVSAQRAASASHTTPITVAAEQGVAGLAAYLALVALALRRLGRGARGSVGRMVVLAAFCALLLHTMLYAAFLEDPLTWTLLGAGTALAAAARPAPARGDAARGRGRPPRRGRARRVRATA